MTTTKKAALIASFAVFALAACNNSNQQGNTENQTASLDTLYSATSNEVTDKGTIVYDKFTFPVDSIYSTKVMGVGTFHHDEVLENASKLKWFGLFQGEKGDGVLDLIIDTSNHYNGESPTIYLSRPAENGEVVKPVGGYSWVGC